MIVGIAIRTKRDVPANGDTVIDTSTGFVYNYDESDTTSPESQTSPAVIKPTYYLGTIQGRYKQVSTIGGSAGHTIKDSSTTFTARTGLKFTGNVTVTDDLAGDNTVVNIPTITVDETPTDGSNNAVSSNGTFDALDLKATKPLTPTTGKMWKSGADGNPVEASFTDGEVLQTSAIDTPNRLGWLGNLGYY